MLSLVEILFLFMAGSVWVTGEMVTRWRDALPPVLLQSYLYGSFAHRGPESQFVKRFELPKSAFKHFYVFAAFLTSITLWLMLAVYFREITPFYLLRYALMAVLEQYKPSVCVAAAVTSITLLSLQIYRRLYETQRLQVFGAHSRINLSHYVVGFLHYLGCIVTILGQAPGFSSDTETKWMDTYTAVVLLPCSVVFLLAWYEQYRTNIIFSELRRDKRTGAVVTDEHRLPRGRWFEAVSSPHRLTEVIMYTSLLVLFPTRTFFCVYLWVLANQVQTAVQAHQWCRNNFKNYPDNRKAIFPTFL